MRILLIALILLSFNAYGLKFNGLIEGDLKKINTIFKTPLSNKTSYNQLDQIINWLSAQNHYEYAFYEKTKNNKIIITAVQAKSIFEVNFINNNNFSDAELLKISKLKRGQDFSKTKIDNAIKRIKKAYIKDSYLNTFIKVQISEVGKSNKSYKIDLIIQENAICEVNYISSLSSNKKLNKSIELHLKRYRGRKLTEKILKKISQRTLDFLNSKQYYFSDIKINKPQFNKQKTTATITIDIKNPFKYEFYYEGLDRVAKYQIKEQIEDLYENNWSKDPVNKISEKIRQFYNKLGFIKARVKVVPKTLVQQYIKRVYITVNEGQKIKIKDIKFGGKFSAEEKELLDFLKSNSPEPFANNFYTQESLDEGINNLIYDLKNKGFLHAKHISTRIKYTKEFEVNLTIIINEGPKTLLNSISLEGNETITYDEIINLIGLQPGKIFNLRDFEDSLRKITDYYYKLGFIEMKFLDENNFIKYSKKNTRADINYKIYEGPQVRLKNIVIEGNDFTKDYVILREIQLEAGDILSTDRILRAQTNLTRLGLFTSVDIRTSNSQSAVKERDLLITVTERKPGLFKLGVGANNERGLNLRGYTGASYNNLFGTARAIYTRLDAETRFEDKDFLDKVWKVSGGYVEPYLFNSLIRGRVRTEVERSISGSGETLKSNLNRRLSFLIEKDVFKDLKLVYTLWQLDSQSQTLEITRNKERVDVAATGPSLYYDSRDSKFLPTKGYYSNIDFMYSTPELGASDVAHFMKTEGQVTTYKSFLNKHLVWATSLRGGYANTVGNAEGLGIPEDYLFILGGMSTVRGFGGRNPINRIPSSLELDRTKQVIETNHAYYGLLKTEFRFLLPGKNHGPVFFWDTGLVEMGGSVGDNIKHPMRHSYGLGYRFNSIVGPIVLEYGFKARRPFGTQEKSGQFHISLGSF